jgi:integrase
MPRRAKGSITTHKGADGLVYRTLRFHAYGKRHRIPLGAVSEDDAAVKLGHTLADVERGVWQPPADIEPAAEPTVTPTFHEYAEQWWTLNEGDWRETTRADYRWRLELHLIPYFGATPLDKITPRMVKEYRAAKLAEAARNADALEAWRELAEAVSSTAERKQLAAERPARVLSSRSINMTLTLLGAILAAAIDDDEYGITRNSARGQRVKEREPGRSYLDNAGQIVALLDAAGALDRAAPRNRRHIKRRAMLAVLTFAGLRINELCRLRWRNVDLAGGWLTTGSKTDAGYRKVKIRGALRDELLTLRAGLPSIDQSAYVFATARGGMMSADNFRSRVLRAAVRAASEALEADGLPPLPAKITPHSLRRTFCSLLYALGEDPGVVMDEMGHTDPALALRVYRQAMRRGEDEKAALRELVEGATSEANGANDRANVLDAAAN